MTTIPFHTPLNEDQQLAAGLPQPWPLAMADRVRFGELDRLVHVNNAHYMRWFETVRIRYFRDWGISSYQPSDPKVVIRRAEIDYLEEMRMDEDYIITARTRTFRTTSLTVDQELWSDGRLRATFACVIVLLTPDGNARFPLPDDLKDKFVEIDGAVPPT